jgi:hypothetical protein
MDPQRLLKYIKDSGLSYSQNSKSFIFTCPLCNSKDKLYIRKSDGKFACWKCRETEGFQGAPEFAFKELLEKPLQEIKEGLYGHGGYSGGLVSSLKLNDFIEEPEEATEEILEEPPELTFPYHCLPIAHEGASKGLKYLEHRGIPLDIAHYYKIGYSPEKQSVVFPSYVNGRLVGWQYRTVEDLTVLMPDDSIKYRIKSQSSKDLPKETTFMFQDYLEGKDHAVLCEGPIDAIKAHLVGGGIAALGKAVSRAQVSWLLRTGIKTVYVALDPDAFGELRPLLHKFQDGVELLKVELPKGRGKTDLGSLDFEDARKCILAAKPLERNKLYLWLRPTT